MLLLLFFFFSLVGYTFMPMRTVDNPERYWEEVLLG